NGTAEELGVVDEGRLEDDPRLFADPLLVADQGVVRGAEGGCLCRSLVYLVDALDDDFIARTAEADQVTGCEAGQPAGRTDPTHLLGCVVRSQVHGDGETRAREVDRPHVERSQVR